MTQQQNKFVKGAALLGAAGLIVKLIGAFYRVPLTHIIGDVGIGYYQAAYPIYSALLTISTAGLPTAISKMVSESLSRGKEGEARRIMSVSLRLLAAAGLIMSAILLLFADPIARAMGEPKAALTIRAIAPAVFFASVLSAYRGFFQGHQNMLPTASTQIVEQAFKLIAGFALAFAWLGQGPDHGAAGALTGVTISEIAALGLILVLYARHCARTPLTPEDASAKSISAGSILKQLLPLAIPVMIGACVMPIVSSLDNFLVMNRLQSIGYSVTDSTSMFGLLTGVVYTLVNMPSVLTLALCMSLVPAIAQAGARGDLTAAGDNTRQGAKMAVLIGLPCAVGMAILSEPILYLLYGNLSPERLKLGAQLLTAMAPGIFLLGLVQTLTGALQGYGRVYIPVFSLLAGAVCKVVLSFLLLGNPSVHIFGAPIGTVVCYGVAAILDAWQAGRIMKIRWRPVDLLIKPGLAALGMGLAVYAFMRLAQGHISMRLIALAGVVVGVIAYVIFLIVFKAVNAEELALLPGGGKLKKLALKLGLGGTHV